MSRHRTALRNGFLLVLLPLFLGGCQTLTGQSGPVAQQPRPGTSAQARPSPRQPVANHAGSASAPVAAAPTAAGTGPASPAGDTDLWNRMRAGFALDLSVSHPRVDSETRWFAKHNDYLDRCVDRATPYLHYIIGELEKRGMPLELAMLPMVESAFNPYAYSPSHASGLWQFIGSTGRVFGLRQDWWYDGRRDVIESTRAALDYLQKLNRQFDGDWLLAMAAYNAGERRVGRAVSRNRKAGLPTDFFSLRLPRETTAYVPKLLAVARLVADPDRHGVTWKPVPNQPYFTVVDAGGQVELGKVAKMAGVGMDEIYRLNPGYTRWATPPEGPHRILVPVGRGERLHAALAELPSGERTTYRHYTIRRGDSLSTIAARHGTSVDVLRTANKLSGNRIRAGKTLLIPGPGQSAGAIVTAHTNPHVRQVRRSKTRRAATTVYTVRRGDSLWKIARRYRVSVAELSAWNGVGKATILRPGQKLRIRAVSSPSVIARAPKTGTRKVDYRVSRGDSLWKIARKHRVAVSDIRRWNSLSGSKYLKPGQLLTLFLD